MCSATSICLIFQKGRVAIQNLVRVQYLEEHLVNKCFCVSVRNMGLLPEAR